MVTSTFRVDGPTCLSTLTNLPIMLWSSASGMEAALGRKDSCLEHGRPERWNTGWRHTGEAQVRGQYLGDWLDGYVKGGFWLFFCLGVRGGPGARIMSILEGRERCE